MEFHFDAGALPSPVATHQASPGLEVFRLRVQQDGELQARLAAVPATEFMAHVLQAAASLGLEISPADVNAEMSAARRGWLERGLR